MALLFLSPLHKAIRQIGVHLSERMTPLGVKGSEGHLLSYLAGYGPCRVGELLRVFGLKPSTLTGVLDRLAARGLVRRTSDPDDRRSFRVALTAKGRRLAERVNAEVAALETALRNEIDDGDLQGFRAVMEAISRCTGVELRSEERP